MTFSALPIGKFFIHKNSSGEFHGWRKANCLSARKVTRTGVTYGEAIPFDIENEVLVGVEDMFPEPIELWRRQLWEEAFAGTEIECGWIADAVVNEYLRQRELTTVAR